MARFAKIDRRMFGDEKYRRLTAPPPGGQVLWWHLLAGKQTGIIPGLYSIGESAFAEHLGWTLKGFREAFGEVFREGMAKADWKAPLIWVPNAIKYNEPASPNVIKSWHAPWDELPECALKQEAWYRLKAFVEGMGKGFREAFAKALPEPFKEGFGESIAGAGALAGDPPNPPEGGVGGEDPASKGGGFDPLAVELPHTGPAFRTAWAEWVAYRSGSKKNALTEHSVPKQLKLLGGLSEADAVACIEKSIRNTWAGLFPPDQKSTGRPGFQTRGQAELQYAKNLITDALSDEEPP